MCGWRAWHREGAALLLGARSWGDGILPQGGKPKPEGTKPKLSQGPGHQATKGQWPWEERTGEATRDCRSSLPGRLSGLRAGEDRAEGLGRPRQVGGPWREPRGGRGHRRGRGKNSPKGREGRVLTQSGPGPMSLPGRWAAASCTAWTQHGPGSRHPEDRNNPAVLRSLAASWSEPQDCRWRCKGVRPHSVVSIEDDEAGRRGGAVSQAGERGRSTPRAPRRWRTPHPSRPLPPGPGLRGLHGAHVRGHLLRAAVLRAAAPAPVLEQEAVQQGAQRGRG